MEEFFFALIPITFILSVAGVLIFRPLTKRLGNVMEANALAKQQVVDDKLHHEHVKTLPDFPDNKLNMIRHMILSHHGQHEFGSPKMPMFIEAIVLHYIDNMDAKIKDFSNIIADDKNADPDWTAWIHGFQRPLYKG